MKNKLLLTFMVMLMGTILQAQVSGTYTIPGAQYPTIASAIAAMNAQGIGSGGVTFNITAGYTETFLNSDAGVLTANTSSATRPIVFQKAGEGPNPVVIAGKGRRTYTNPPDAILAFGGSDYVTLDGINMESNPIYSSATEKMEVCIFLGTASSDDGCQHFTLKNCKITGNFIYASVFAVRTKVTGGGVGNATSFSGTHSYIKIYNDTILNTDSSPVSGSQGNMPIALTGSSDADLTGFYDYGNEIGVGGRNVFLNTATINTSYQKGLQVANNLFTTLNKASYSNPIYCNFSKSTRIYNNEIGPLIAQTGCILLIGDYGNKDTALIFNNYIHDITSMINNQITGIFSDGVGFVNKIYSNRINNITYGSGTTTTGSFVGIKAGGNANPPTGSTFEIYDNTISGNAITHNQTGNTNRFIMLPWLGPVARIFNNTITNNTTNCIGNSMLIDLNGTNNTLEKYVYGNTLSNHANTGGTIIGIYQAYGARSYIYQNKISGITSSATDAKIFGMQVAPGGSFTQVYNNYISELYTPATSGLNQVIGLNITGSSDVKAYHNTIYLDATSTGLDFGTSGIYAATAPTLNLRNNIVANNSVPSGAGRTVAFRYGGPSLVNLSTSSNNNNYFSGTPDTARLIFFDGTNKDETLMAYKTRVYPAEAFSVSANPAFINAVTTPYDLHMDLTTGNESESAGTIMALPDTVFVDYYKTPRYPNTGFPFNPSFPPVRPDIGAEEFGGIFKVTTPPNVELFPLPNTSSLTSRTLTTTITDLTGVPTTGTGLPVLYWNVNNGAWIAATGTSLGSDQYAFTFGASVSLNDSVKYFIVSQNMNTNIIVGSTPPGADGLTINPPAAITPPLKPFAYKIINPVCGTFTVGSGGDYPTLTAAVNDVNSKEVTCPVTLLLTDLVYAGETLPITINNIAGLSPVNTLTIKPAPGNTPSIQGRATSIITFNGARYVTIDGSNNGGTSRDLTLWNSKDSSGIVVLFKSPGDFTQAASFDVLKNCNIRGRSQINTSLATYGIVCSGTGGGYENLVMENNAIYSATIGVRISGSVTYPSVNCQVINNIIGTPVDSTSIQLYGIYVTQADNTLVEGNDVMGPSQNGNTNNNLTGIRIYNMATNSKVRKNKVHGWYLNPTGTQYVGPWGIAHYEFSQLKSGTEISNNLVYDIKGIGTSDAFYALAGISIVWGGGVNVWNNTVNLTGAILKPTVTSNSGCITISAYATSGTIDIRNNILKNNLQTTSGVGNNVRTFGIFSMSPVNVFSILDNNDYFITGINPNIGSANSSVTNYATLAAWQGATGKDTHSVNVDPSFTSATDLHTVVPALNNAGAFIPAVITDYSNILRTNPPDMGAYEFTLAINAINTLPATNANYSSADLNGNINTNGEQVEVFFEYGTTAAYGNTIAADPVSVRSFAPTAFYKTITGLLPNTLYHYRAKGVSTTSTQLVYGEDMTFTVLELPTIQGPENICEGTVSNVYTTEPGKYDYTWTVSGGGTITAGGTLTDNTVTVSWDATGAQTVSVNYRQAPGGSFAPAPTVYPVSVNPNLPISISIVASANPTCIGAQCTFTATPVNGGTNPAYQWKVNGANEGTNSPVFTYVPLNGEEVTCTLTSDILCNTGNPATSNTITMSLSPLSPVSVSIVASANPTCANSSVTFTATATNGGTSPSFQWNVNDEPVGTNSTVFTYNPVQSDYIYCILTSNFQCPSGNLVVGSNQIDMTVRPYRTVGISIVASANPVCSGTNVNFTATASNGGTAPVYEWKVNGTIAGTNSRFFTYAPVNGDIVTCTVTSNYQCITGSPVKTSSPITMTVNPSLPVSVSIIASANPVTAGATVTYTAIPVNGGANPSYQWKVNGLNVGTSTVVYEYIPVDQDVITCILTSNATCATGSPATSNAITMTVNPEVPANTTVIDTVLSGEDTCFNATSTITVAGNGTTFTVQNGGSATMIAGEKILYLPGTMVEAGGYMLGYITLTNEYCGVGEAPMVAVKSGVGETPATDDKASFRIYPNPTTGSFTLEFSQTNLQENLSAFICDIRGNRILDLKLSGSNKQVISLENQPKGVYFIRVIRGQGPETGKIIKQ